MQKAAHGTAFMRFGEISSSQCRQTPYEPSATRRSARRICRSMVESRSRFRIASSRSPANCTSSSASGAFSMAVSSRLRSAPLSSLCFDSRMFLYFSSSALVISVSSVFQTRRAQRAFCARPVFVWQFSFSFLSSCVQTKICRQSFKQTAQSEKGVVPGSKNRSGADSETLRLLVEFFRFSSPHPSCLPPLSNCCAKSGSLQILYRLHQSNRSVHSPMINFSTLKSSSTGLLSKFSSCAQRSTTPCAAPCSNPAQADATGRNRSFRKPIPAPGRPFHAKPGRPLSQFRHSAFQPVTEVQQIDGGNCFPDCRFQY